MYLNSLDFTMFEIENENLKYETALSKKSITNINDMLIPQEYPFIHRPQSRYVASSNQLFKELWDEQRLSELVNKPVHIQFAVEIEHYKLYEVFQHHFTINNGMNIHDYSINSFKSLCAEEGMPFSNVIWEGDLLYFIWEVKEPVLFNNKFQLFTVFWSFLGLVDSVGIEHLVFSPTYTKIKAKQFSYIMWNSCQFGKYNHKHQHRKQVLYGQGFNYVDSDGSILNYTD